MTDPVLVGVDGSRVSRTAAWYAAACAAQRGAPLVLLYAYLRPLSYALTGGPDPAAAGRAASATLAELAAELRSRWPMVDVRQEAEPGAAAVALIAGSRRSQLLVLGAQGGGGRIVLGSVAAQVAAHARCPVVVLRDDPRTHRSGPVAVGVDGSADATAAAVVAAGEAARRGQRLVLVHGWWANPYASLTDRPTERDALTLRTAETVLAHAAAAVLRAVPGVPLTSRPVRTPGAAESLLDASRTAGLLVVGRRGFGGFAGLELGAVARGVLHRAHCPVLLVHGVRESARPPAARAASAAS